MRGAKQRAQQKNAIENAPGGFVDGHVAFGVELAQWNVKHPLILTDLPQAIEGKINTLADAVWSKNSNGLRWHNLRFPRCSSNRFAE